MSYLSEHLWDSFDSLESLDNTSGVHSMPIHHDAAMFSGSSYDALNNAGNILTDILSDEQFMSLRKLGLLNEKALRDFHIRKIFREMRNQHLSAHHAIERIQSMYSYLQFDTLRKIVYQINDKEKER